MKTVLGAKPSTNTCLVYIETERFHLYVSTRLLVIVCINKLSGIG